jgi:hypothetical protein
VGVVLVKLLIVFFFLFWTIVGYEIYQEEDSCWFGILFCGFIGAVLFSALLCFIGTLLYLLFTL